MKVSELKELECQAYKLYLDAKNKLHSLSPFVAEVEDYDWVNFDFDNVPVIEGCEFSYEGMDMFINVVFCDSMEVVDYLKSIGFKFKNIIQNK